MSDDPAGVRIGERLIPFPRSISEEAQAALRRLVRDDGIPLNSLHTMPAPDDREGWARLKAAVEGYYATSIKASAGTPGAAIETLHIGSATVHRATPATPLFSDCAFIDLHGGAFVFGGGEACRVSAGLAADQHQVTCYGVDYRMPPEYPSPAALDDCLATYFYVLERHRPETIIVGGRSAGGNLACALLLRARAEGLPLPAALVLLSPELDLTESGDSFAVNQMADVVLPGSLMAANLLYAGGADLTHPYVSPLFGEFEGFPPTFLQSGTRDLFLSNAARFSRLLRREGVPIDFHLCEAMPHGGFGGTPEDAELATDVASFVRRHWPAIG
jgi:monoterpene epsilon-lactone hydrolase